MQTCLEKQLPLTQPWPNFPDVPLTILNNLYQQKSRDPPNGHHKFQNWKKPAKRSASPFAFLIISSFTSLLYGQINKPSVDRFLFSYLLAVARGVKPYNITSEKILSMLIKKTFPVKVPYFITTSGPESFKGLPWSMRIFLFANLHNLQGFPCSTGQGAMESRFFILRWCINASLPTYASLHQRGFL